MRLGETEDRVQWRAKLVAHAGQEIRFGEIGLVRRGDGAFQRDVIFLQRQLEPFAFRDIARCGKHPRSLRSRSCKVVAL